MIGQTALYKLDDTDNSGFALVKVVDELRAATATDNAMYHVDILTAAPECAPGDRVVVSSAHLTAVEYGDRCDRCEEPIEPSTAQGAEAAPHGQGMARPRGPRPRLLRHGAGPRR